MASCCQDTVARQTLKLRYLCVRLECVLTFPLRRPNINGIFFYSFQSSVRPSLSSLLPAGQLRQESSMKVFTSSILIAGCATAFSPIQQVLKTPQHAQEAWPKTFHDLQKSLKSLNGEARAIWDEVATMFPEAMDKANLFSPPKKHARKPDTKWDFITKGADVQGVWVKGNDGTSEREIDGKLENYNMRSKAVNPGALGVDPGVKQISGYLDDEENDKHLFYCGTCLSPVCSTATNLS